MKRSIVIFTFLGLCVLLSGFEPISKNKKGTITALGKPTEGTLKPFTGEPFFQKEVVFTGEKDSVVREPYLAVAVDGTVLVMRDYAKLLRRSEDGGRSWGEIIEVPFGFKDTNFIIDENTGDILVVRLWDATDRLWRSSDHGKTWKEEKIILKPNEVMKWMDQTGLKKRTSWDRYNLNLNEYCLHNNASESGITLRHGEKKGRLLVTGTIEPFAKEHPCDRKPLDRLNSLAIYSDDNGATWQVSGFFPKGFTDEAALAELHDGRIYYNSRSHKGFYDKSLARELLPEESLRWEAWSYDNGQTWVSFRVSEVLPDGGGYSNGYGCKGGLVRLPVKDKDILIYSNADTGPGDRVKMTVWASFDGGETWPIKRLVNAGTSAYSSLGVGRPGTPSEGMIYLLFEGGPKYKYSGMQVVRFNVSWVLKGELTGNGKIPEWIQ